jgi:hypothetical protein
VYLAGEIAQHDFWFPPVELPVGFGQARSAKQLPVLTMITGYARHVDGLLIPSRNKKLAVAAGTGLAMDAGRAQAHHQKRRRARRVGRDR